MLVFNIATCKMGEDHKSLDAKEEKRQIIAVLWFS
jgi:hypothetical protein